MHFCKALRPGYSYKSLSSLSGFEAEWDALLPSRHGLRSETLRAVEESRIENLKVAYLLIFKQDRAIGRVYLQSFRIGRGNLAPEVWEQNATALLGKLAFHRRPSVLVCGNLFQLGQPGFWFSDPEEENQLPEILDDWEMRHGNRHSAFLVKDLPQKLPEDLMNKYRYRCFSEDVTMNLSLPPTWQTFDHYLQALSKKYRQRAQKILTAGSGLSVRYLNREEVSRYASQLDGLYRQVWEKQGWKPAYLGASYFLAHTQFLSSDFQIQAFFEGDEIRAFASHWQHPEGQLEIHYIGLDYAHNERLSLYFTLLFEAIRTGIDRGLGEVWFGRTSEDAKANAGAHPVYPTHYVKIRRGIASLLFQILQSNWARESDPAWKKRHPLRAESTESYAVESL